MCSRAANGLQVFRGSVLFTLLAERYERGSVLLTSNLPFSKWDQIFKDAMTTAAAIDRLVHHSVIIELNVPSFRVETAQNTKANGQSAAKKQPVSNSQQGIPIVAKG